MNNKTITLLWILMLLTILLVAYTRAYSVQCNLINKGGYWYSETYTGWNCTAEGASSSMIMGGVAMSANDSSNTTFIINATISAFTGLADACGETNISVVAVNQSGTETVYDYLDNITIYPCVNVNTTSVDFTRIDNYTCELIFNDKVSYVDTKLYNALNTTTDATGIVLVKTNLGEVNISMDYRYMNASHDQLDYIAVLKDNGVVRVRQSDVVRQDKPFTVGAGGATIILIFGLSAGYAASRVIKS